MISIGLAAVQIWTTARRAPVSWWMDYVTDTFYEIIDTCMVNLMGLSNAALDRVERSCVLGKENMELVEECCVWVDLPIDLFDIWI